MDLLNEHTLKEKDGSLVYIVSSKSYANVCSNVLVGNSNCEQLWLL